MDFNVLVWSLLSFLCLLPQDVHTHYQVLGYNSVKRNNKESYFVAINYLATWKEANKICEEIGEKGSLASVTNEAEEKLIDELVKEEVREHMRSYQRVWLGGYLEQKTSKWSWIAGHEFKYTNFVKGHESPTKRSNTPSSYCLTYDDGTELHELLDEYAEKEIDEDVDEEDVDEEEVPENDSKSKIERLWMSVNCNERLLFICQTEDVQAMHKDSLKDAKLIYHTHTTDGDEHKASHTGFSERLLLWLVAVTIVLCVAFLIFLVKRYGWDNLFEDRRPIMNFDELDQGREEQMDFDHEQEQPTNVDVR